MILRHTVGEIQRVVDISVKAYKGFGMEVNHANAMLAVMRYDAPTDANLP